MVSRQARAWAGTSQETEQAGTMRVPRSVARRKREAEALEHPANWASFNYDLKEMIIKLAFDPTADEWRYAAWRW
jgi:hypothetical protein